MRTPPGCISVDNKPCRHFLDRLREGVPFAFPKRTHGIWDHLSLLEGGAFEAGGWRLVDQMIFKQKMEDGPGVQAERDDYLQYLREIRQDVAMPPDDFRYIETVSLSLDYLTKKLLRPWFELHVRTDPRLQRYWRTSYSYSTVFDALGLWNRRWQYAHMPTAGIVTGDLLGLPEIARLYHVVLLGPAKMADLAQRWRLHPGRFTFIPAPAWPDKRPHGSVFSDPVLPALQTFRQRHTYLKALQDVPSERKLLYLFEAGTASQWWIHRLFEMDPSHTYLDIGRPLELWFPETDWPLKTPVKVAYRRAARTYYGELRYKELLGRRQQ